MPILKSLLLAGALSLAGVALAQAQTPKAAAKPQATDVQERTKVEAELKRAREQLEVAAREVARLSGQLTGPMAYDYFVTRQVLGNRGGARLGVEVENSEDAAAGAVIRGVTPDSPAAAAGLQVGDVLVAVDGKSLEKSADGATATLIGQMSGVKPGDKVEVQFRRDGKQRSAVVVAEAALPLPNRGLVWLGKEMDERRAMENHLRERYTARPGVMLENHALEGAKGPVSVLRFMGHDMLDMELVTLTPKLGRYFGAEKGVMVLRPPGDATMKLEEGDVILDIDGREPQSGVHAMRILRSYQPGEELSFGIMRERKKMKLAVTMPKRGEIEAPPRTFRIPPTPSRDEAT